MAFGFWCAGWADGTMQLGLCAVHMRAPIRHDAVAGIRSIPSASVAHDGVIRDARRDRDGVDRLHETIVGREGVNAIRDAFELQVAGMKGRDLQSVVARAQEA